MGGLKSTVIIPLTTRLVGAAAYPLRVQIPIGSCRLDRPSELLIDQLLAWDNTLFREDLGVLPEEIRENIKRAIKDFLDLD